MKQKSIREHVKCCFCDGALKDPINFVNIPKIATWKKPVSGNIFRPKETKLAIAIMCIQCIREGKYPKFAVEWSGLDDEIEVIYHPVDELDEFIRGG